MSIEEFYHFINTGGTIAVLLIVIVGGMRRWYVWASFYNEKVREAEEWKAAALHGTYTAEKAVDLAHRNINTQ